MGDVNVTQADRELVVTIGRYQRQAAAIRRGDWDETLVVKEAARHRLSAQIAEPARDVMRGPEKGVNCPDCGCRIPSDYTFACPDCGNVGALIAAPEPATQQPRADVVEAGDTEYDRLKAQKDRILAKRRTELTSVLQQHHDWHMAQTEADEFGIIPADAYSESVLCDRTIAALRTQAPEPRADVVEELAKIIRSKHTTRRLYDRKRNTCRIFHKGDLEAAEAALTALRTQAPASDEARELLVRLTHENGPICLDQMGDGLAWRPLDHGTWQVFDAALGAKP